jgi:Protein of unknown function (DUF4019)
MSRAVWCTVALAAYVGWGVTRTIAAEKAAMVAARTNPEDAAQKVAEAWVVLADTGRYGEAWDASARVFRAAVPRAAFVQQAGAARDPLGEVVLRTLKSREYRTSLPGAPDGKYVVIQYQTAFANNKDTLETITPTLDADGKWRVSGYFIK